MSSNDYAATPQANVEIGIEIDFTTPGKLRPFPAPPDLDRRLSAPTSTIIQIDCLLNLEDDLSDVGCPICGSWSAAMHDDGTCDNPQCVNAKTPQA